MSIAESQLITWSHQGSIAQSRDTYNSIKNTLLASGTPYASRKVVAFLQGSYGNDTNIYAESDVDIVVQLNESFLHDSSDLPLAQKQLLQSTLSDSSYSLAQFKIDVQKVLIAKYGSDVKSGTKAFSIAASGNRRKADVVVCTQYRRYHRFNGISDQSYDEGICFYNSYGVQIVNYPKQHSANLTQKHQQTGSKLKPMVRILKNMRGKLVDKQMISADVAPSYYLEGLLYNVPPEKFSSSYSDSFVNAISWIQQADQSQFVCANKQYYLLRDGSLVSWQKTNCQKFLTAAVKMWNE